MSIVALSPAAVVVTTVCFNNLPLVCFDKDRDQSKSQRTHLSGALLCKAHGSVWHTAWAVVKVGVSSPSQRLTPITSLEDLLLTAHI